MSRRPFHHRPSRSRGLVSVLVAGTAVWTIGLGLAPQAATRQATARETRQRVVSIAVVKDDVPIRDLNVKEVAVKEDGLTREVLSVAPALPPSHLALLLDDSESSQPLVNELRNGSGGFLKSFENNTPAPMVALWTFGERPVRVTDYSTNIGISGSAAMKVFSRTGAGAYLLEAILEVCKDLKKLEAPRPVIVAYVTEEGPEFSNESHDRVEEALREVGASLWVVALQSRGPESESREVRERSQVLGDVARASGGITKPILSRQSIGAGFTSVAALISGRVDVTYGRPDTMVPPKKLEITVSRSGVKVQAPRWPR